MSATLYPDEGKNRRSQERSVSNFSPIRAVFGQAALEWGVPLLIGLFLWLVWILTARQVVVTVDDFSEAVWTHRATFGSLLLDLGLDDDALGQLAITAEQRIATSGPLLMERARPFRAVADGREVRVNSHGATAKDVLQDAGIHVDVHDRLWIDDVPFAWDQPLPGAESVLAATAGARSWDQVEIAPLEMRVARAVPIMVKNGAVAFEVQTTAQTVGEALFAAGIQIYEGDWVDPALGSPIDSGMRIQIERSQPVAVQLDGRLVQTRTRAKTVADALSELGFGLSGLDEVSPSLDTQLTDNLEITITRIREEIEIDEDVEPFETIFVADPELLIDTQQLTNPGAAGITRRRSRVRYENGEEVWRELEDTWIAQDPVPRTIAFGQNIVPQTHTTNSGEEITYWRKIRVIATSYSANTAGVPTTVPWYGITFTGEKMRRGIVAVDPRVVPLYSNTFLEGYGFGEALDTGSAIKGRRVDLGYDDWNLELWNSWQDIYLLWPPPPDYQITWVLPNWPVVPQ